MTRGESLKVLIDYDLFDNNLNGEVVIFLKQDKRSNKCLVYSPTVDEWAELRPSDVERLNPGVVPNSNQEFIDNIRTMISTYGVD